MKQPTFIPPEEAKKFADKMKIELTATVYIEQEDFIEGDLMRMANILNKESS